MDIERINENTVKFYISYVDIERRGFEKEEIWYNRERSEQLFWQMMDEVNYEEDFIIDGPLWIQVQALEKGLEVIVTKANMSKELSSRERLDELIDELVEDDAVDITFGGKKANESLEEQLDDEEQAGIENDEDASLWMTLAFNDLEEVIQLSYYFTEEYYSDLETILYHYEDKYYLYLELAPEIYDYSDSIMSKVLEFGKEVHITPYILNEYGKVIMDEDVFSQMRKYFTA